MPHPKRAKTYTRIVMFDFDGTLFRSWEKTPEWWPDARPYSFFMRPESMNEPCVPARPGSNYWIRGAVAEAREAGSRRDTLTVVVTGRVKVHEPRIRELLSQAGIRAERLIFNPGMNAATYKTRVLGMLLASNPTIDEIHIWENENMGTYAKYLQAAKVALSREDVEVEVHTVAEHPVPLTCTKEDFTPEMRVASRWLAAGASNVVYERESSVSSFGSQVVSVSFWRTDPNPDPFRGSGFPTFLYSRTWSRRRDGEHVDSAVDGTRTFFTTGDKAFTPEEFHEAWEKKRLPNRVMHRLLSQSRFRGAEEVHDVHARAASTISPLPRKRAMSSDKSTLLMKFLSGVASRHGVGDHVYVVGGAPRNHLMGVPIKDLDVTIDVVALGPKRDSAWFAQQVAREIPTHTSLVTNNYGVAILTVKGPWLLNGEDLSGEVIEIANTRKESYTDGGPLKGKGYKPTDVQPATIHEDLQRREFSFNTLLWRLSDLTHGPEHAEVLDMLGVGKQHLEDREMHTPGDPDRTFSDDPTRLLRAIKFVAKYGMKLSPAVSASITRNAPKLATMPWEAVGTLLVDDVLSTPVARKALTLMDSLGLVSVLGQMLRDSKPFASYLAGQLRTHPNVGLLLDLADMGLGSHTPVSFLTREQQARLREVTSTMPSEEARAFLDALRTPKLDNEALIAEFNIPPRDRGVLGTMAREELLLNYMLARDPAKLTWVVRERLR